MTEKKDFLYEGKAKILYKTENEDQLIQVFKDDATAGDGAKKGKIKDKGIYNNTISSHMFEYFESYNVPTHFIKQLSETEMLVKNVTIFPIEVVMRNIAAGSLCKRYGIEEGKELEQPVLEHYLKNDELHDPLMNSSHIKAFGMATEEELAEIDRLAIKINALMKDFFSRRNLLVVDFKLEFGTHKNKIILADEISPDTCRFWDAETKKKLDKDRFRQDLGGIEDAYEEIRKRVLSEQSSSVIVQD